MFLPLAGGVVFPYWAILIFLGSYVLLMYPLYGEKAIWVLGLAWGSVEGLGFVEASLLFGPEAVVRDTPLWFAYMTFLAVFFSVSLIALRKNVGGRTRARVVLAGLMVAWLPFAWFILRYLPIWYLAIYDLLGIFVVLANVEHEGSLIRFMTGFLPHRARTYSEA